MENILSKRVSKNILASSIFDLFAIATIYFVPTISHLFALPIYFIEPMRLMLILSIAHTSKKNAYFLAATLPVFSFLVSGHPVFLKTFLISGELVLNVWLFHFLLEKINNKFGVMIVSIALSKIAYYVLKFLFLSLLLLDGSLISTPILIQVIMMFVFSSYILLMKNRFE